MSVWDRIDPIRFANQWSFNGRYYVWVSFFHGLALLTGRDVAAHDAFQGRVYHTNIFGPQGALYHGIAKLDPTEAEERLRFGEKAMAQLRVNEVRYLFKAATSWKSAGLLIGYCIMVGTLAAITYGIGTGETEIAYGSFPCLFLPFISGSLGKRLVRRLWNNKRATMGSFIHALPWMTVSTPQSR
ncbi:hypothetical protein [Rhizobium sp. MHM7A]|uniref:hypothetical protein n=1 Tax=Rhizobium sp. MHM7A TaxID=2583233 RepID=UPI0011059C47|nr:hypothetical protein [Rhizobium sp. MHM7A]TLX16634.1 hypothetical protein FFR93_04645 [Rhizobium sp. MHM7A]